MAQSNNPFGPPHGAPQYEFAGELRNPFLPTSSSTGGASLLGVPTQPTGWPQPSSSPQPGAFRPSSSFGQQLEAQMNVQQQQQQQQQQQPPFQGPQGHYGGAPNASYGPGYSTVQDLDPFSGLSSATWAQAPPPQQPQQQPSAPQPTSSPAIPSPTRDKNPKEYVQAHRTELEAFDPVAWRQLGNAYTSVKTAWEDRRSLILRALDGALSPQDGDRAQTLLREADLNIDSIVAATFQLQEAREGWQHSTDTGSRRRVREQLNASLRSLPDWPEKLDAQRLAEQSLQAQTTGYEQQTYDPYGQQQAYLQQQATGYGQHPLMQRPSFTGAPQTWTSI